VTVRSNCLARFIAYGGERTLWVALMLSLVELSLFSTNNILNPSFETTPRMLSTVASLFTFIFLVSFPIFIYKLTNRHYTQLWNPEFYHRYAFFFCEFKLSKKWSKTFMSIVVGRLVLYGILVAALQQKPFTQTFCICLVQFAYLILLIRIKPLISKVMTILNYIMEFALFVVFIFYCILGWDKQNGDVIPPGPKESIADILVWGIVVVVATAILCMVYMILMKIWSTIKRCIDGTRIKGMDMGPKEEEKKMFEDDKEEEKEPELDLEKEFMDGGLGKREGEYDQDEDDIDLEAEFEMG